MPRTQRTAPPKPRAFTLVELIVGVLIIGILAAIGMVGFAKYTDRAELTAAQTQLRQAAQAAQLRATSDGALELTRQMTADAIEEHLPVTVHAGQSAATVWDLLGPGEAPTSDTDLSLAFEDARGAPSPDAGTRMLMSTTTASGHPVAILVAGVDAGACFIPLDADANAAAGDLLSRTPYCPKGSGTGNDDEPGDTVAPSAPALEAAAEGDSVQLTWTESTDDTGVAGYEVHRSDRADFTAGPDTLLDFVHELTFADTPPAAGTWYYQVLAFDGAGNSSASRTVPAVTLDKVVTPATPAAALAFDADTGVATISWPAVAGATEYDVRWQVDGGAWVTQQTQDTTLSRTISGGQSITFQVAATNVAGTSPWSAEVSATRAPAAVAVTGSFDRDTATSSVTWTAPTGATSYVVRSRMNGGTWAQQESTSTTATATLTAGQSIDWQVAAVSAAGQGPWSSVLTHQAAPGTPVVTGSFDATTGTSSLQWPAVSSAQEYLVRFSVDGGAWTELTQTTTGATRTISGGQTIVWQVAARNSGGDSPWSGALTYTRTPTSPVLNGTQDFSTLRSTVAWTLPTGATSFVVRFSVNGAAATEIPVSDMTTRTATQNLSYGDQITWQVAAANASGRGAWSNQVTHQAIAQAPQPVATIVDATGVATVTWPAVRSATSYQVEYRVDSGSWTTTSTSELSFSRTISNGQTIAFNVGAVNSAGVSMSGARTLTRSPLAPVVTGSVSGTTSSITWTQATGAMSYVVRYSVDGGAAVDTTLTDVTSRTATKTLLGGQTIAWQVAAVNAAGQGPWSTVVSHQARPDAPTITVSRQADRVLVMWSAVKGATSYTLTAAGGVTLSGSTSSTTYSFQLPRGTTAQVTVSANNATGSAASSASTVSTPLWEDATLANGWVSYNTASYAQMRVTRTTAGVVSLSGLIRNPTAPTATTTVIGTLPAGYRPSGELIFTAPTFGDSVESGITNATGSVRIDVNADGSVTLVATDAAKRSAAASWVSLEGITFVASGELTQTALTATNAWTNYAGTFAPLSLAKDTYGRAHVQGLLRAGASTTFTDGSVFANLGATYTPQSTMHMPTTADNVVSSFAPTTSSVLIQKEAKTRGWLAVQGMWRTTSATAPTTGTLQNSWSRYSTSYPDAGYSKDDDGLVMLTGLVGRGTYTAGTTIMTLPAGMRPSKTLIFNVDASNTGAGNSGQVRVTSAGAVIVGDLRTNAWVSLDSIRFVAEQ